MVYFSIGIYKYMEQTYILLIACIENAIIMHSYMHTCHFIVLNNLYF